MQYSDLTTALGELMVAVITNPASANPSNDPNFNAILPNIINDAEQRIYRELDFLATRQTVYEANALANARIMSIPATTIVLQGANIISAFNVMSQTPSNVNETVEYFLTEGTSTIEITDDSSNVPYIVEGQWINIVTATGTEQEMTGNPILQGPQQIISVVSTAPGINNDFFIQGISASGQNIAQVDPLYSFSTVQGSVQVTVFSLGTYPQLSVGSVVTIGITTLIGINTYIVAGNYVVTSIIDAQTFTFNLPSPANDTGNNNEFNGNIAIQYLAYPLSGTKNRIEFVSKDAMDILWPTDLSEQGIPKYAAFIDNQTMALGPVPDQNYIVEFTGTFRPVPMSATNTATYLGTNYADLFLAACMVFGMLYQKDADQPQGAPPGQDMQKWEGVYSTRKASALSEAQRQKYQGRNWSPYSPTPESEPRP